MNADVIRLIPLTEQELKDIQFTIVDRMMALNRELKSRTSPVGSQEVTREEIERLGKVVEKCSTYNIKKTA